MRTTSRPGKTAETRRRSRILVTLAAGLALTPAAFAQGPQEKVPTTPSPSVWMKQKTAASQNILAALTRADFDTIQLNARSMLAVGYLEGFARADAPGYRDLLRDFQYANKSLDLAAKERNLDGATVAYLQLTISCVNCHKIVRDVR